MVMINIPSDVSLQKEQEYVWLRGGILKFFERFDQYPISGGLGLTPGVISNTCILHILPVTRGTRIYMV